MFLEHMRCGSRETLTIPTSEKLLLLYNIILAVILTQLTVQRKVTVIWGYRELIRLVTQSVPMYL